MKINEKSYRSIWLKQDEVIPKTVQIIDQRYLPHEFIIKDVTNLENGVYAIKEMLVRGAPLIGAMAGFSMYFAVNEAIIEQKKDKSFDKILAKKVKKLLASRPTAVNLQWAVERQMAAINSVFTFEEKINIALKTAKAICEEDVEICRKIGFYGLPIIEAISQKKGGETVNILTHCNAGWIATVDWGTATSPIYQAHNKGLKVHVWVDETRPRNQGARLTAWELGQHGVPHTIITDNAGGHLMQHGKVDICIVGTDRTTRTGDVANKVGTYLKALAAHHNQIPFYVALPSTTIDWSMRNGLQEIPIEQRNVDEVRYIQGWDEADNTIKKVRLTPPDSPAANYAFDVTPAELVTGLITERGICEASEKGLLALFPERK